MSADLILRPVPEAQFEKWRRGREKYGAEWAGDPPLVELYAEQIDSLNYAQHAHEQGHLTTDAYRELRFWIEGVIRVVRRVQGVNPES